MQALRKYLRSLDPRLPRSVWLLEAGGLANMFGTGVVLPFLVIYLHDVRGLSLTMAGIAASANALASLPASTFGGTMIDRFGPKRTIVAALALQAAAIACFPLIRTGWHAVALQVLMGVGNGAFWPAHSSVLTKLAPPDRLHAGFALQRMGANLGIGFGSIIGGALAVVSRPETFTTLFLFDAITFAGFALLLLWMPISGHGGGGATVGRYADVLRNRPVLALLFVNTLLIAAGIVPLVEFLPVYAKNTAGVSEAAIGWIFFANTMCIVLLQLPIAKALEGRRRMPALALMGASWAAMWLVVPVAVESLDARSAAFVLAAVAAVLGLGECLHAPVQAPLVADLAEPHLLGRYMALSSMSWQIGFVIGPVIAGFVLDRWPVALWLGVSAVCALAAGWSLVLERSIPARYRRTSADVAGGGAETT